MQNSYGRHFDVNELRHAANILGMDGEELADYVTGHNCDT